MNFVCFYCCCCNHFDYSMYFWDESYDIHMIFRCLVVMARSSSSLPRLPFTSELIWVKDLKLTQWLVENTGRKNTMTMTGHVERRTHKNQKELWCFSTRIYIQVKLLNFVVWGSKDLAEFLCASLKGFKGQDMYWTRDRRWSAKRQWYIQAAIASHYSWWKVDFAFVFFDCILLRWIFSSQALQQ